MTKLRDMPLSTPWPGPEGGTLGTVSQNAPYGTGGPRLRDVSLETPWPPVYSGPPVTGSMPFATYKFGGATGSLDGATHLDRETYVALSPFKLDDGGALRNTIRAANPSAKIIVYKAMAEMNPGQSNTPTGIRNSDSGINQAQAIAHDNANPGDPWILKDGAGTPIRTWGSTTDYTGDIGSASWQAQWLANIRAMFAFFGLTAGKDGLFVDDMIAYLPAVSTKYGTDAAWRAAVLSFAQNVLLPLKNDGWYVIGNALDKNTDDQLTTTKALWMALAPYLNGCLQEGWMGSYGNPRHMRRDVAGASDYYRPWTDIIVQMQSVGGDAHVMQNSTDQSLLVEGIYGLAAWMQEWNGGGGAYNWHMTTGGLDEYNAKINFDIGQPLGPKTEIQTAVFRRYYGKAVAIINAHASTSYTVTSSPDGRAYTDPSTGAAITFPVTIAAGTAVVWQTASGGGGGGGAAAQKTSVFSDNFNDNSLDPQWTVYTSGAGSTIAESSQQLNETLVANSKVYAGVRLLASDLTGSSAFAKVTPGTLTTVNQEVNFGVSKTNDSSNEYQFTIGHNGTNMVLIAWKEIAGTWTQIGASLTYDAVNHLWLRIRESAGTIFFDTSPDGSTWTNRFSSAADWSPNNIQVYLEVGQKNIVTPAITAVFDGFNTTTSGATTYSAEILAESALLHYFRFGEAAATGTAADSKSPGSVVFTAHAGVTQGATGLITGDTDKAVSLNGGATGYLDMTTGANLGPTSGSWAIEAWINLTGPGSVSPFDYGSILGRDSGKRLLIQTGASGNSKILAQFGGASLFSVANLSLSAIHQVVLEYDSVANLLTLYVDGASVASATPGSAPTLAGTYAVGAYDLAAGTPGSGYMFAGVIDELAIYNAVLGSTKVSSHYINGTT